MHRPVLACLGIASDAVFTSNPYAALSLEGGDSQQQQQTDLPANGGCCATSVDLCMPGVDAPHATRQTAA